MKEGSIGRPFFKTLNLIQESTIEIILFGLALMSVVFPLLAGRWNIPLLGVVARWIRWIFFAGIFSFILHVFELSTRPHWVHLITGFGLWFVLETGYNWLAIKALSASELPLFPKFKENTDGDEWPADKASIEVKEWLRSNKFKRLAVLKAELFEDAFLRASVYESPEGLTRLQVLFIPKRKGDASACYTISTNGKEGHRLITDNHFLPYGGYYPEAWDLCRKPLVGSLPRLVSFHNHRLLRSDLQPEAFEDEPLDELNEQQRILERLNTEIGFLVPRAQQEDEGKITYEGRYRLWKEMWLLAYLGRPAL